MFVDSVGYKNSFWTANRLFGTFERRFSHDYKSTANYLVPGGELL